MPMKDYFKGGRSKHPKFAASQSLGGQYKNTHDRVGTTRFQEEDSPWDNASILPSVPIAGAKYKEWTFYDNKDISLTDVWTEIKAGSGTTLGLLDNVGGGVTFTTGVGFDTFNWYESKQEVVKIRVGKDTWIEAKVRLPTVTQIAPGILTLGFNERLNGQMPSDDLTKDSFEIRFFPAQYSEGEHSGISIYANESGERSGQQIPSTPANSLTENLGDHEWHTWSVHIAARDKADIAGVSINATHTVEVYVDDVSQGSFWITVTDGTEVIDKRSIAVSDTEMAVSFSMDTVEPLGITTQIEYIKVLQDDD